MHLRIFKLYTSLFLRVPLNWIPASLLNGLHWLNKVTYLEKKHMFTWSGDTVVFIRSGFTIYGCYIQFQFSLFTALYYFHDSKLKWPPRWRFLIWKCSPPATSPIKMLKMTPQPNGLPHITGNIGPALSTGTFSLLIGPPEKRRLCKEGVSVWVSI